MCTVTIVPGSVLASDQPEGRDLPDLRMVCNRDERRTRARAHPPAVRAVHGRRVIFPSDPDGGGTWVAVSDAGLAFTLLNVNDSPAAPGHTRALSRGLVIPALVGSADLDEVVGGLRQLDARAFLPFRLLAASAEGLVEVVSTAGALRCRRMPLVGPRLRTSSSLGDDRVAGPRRTLFRRYFHPRRVDPRRQDAFHRHRWPDRSALSVCMSRADAATVSVTTIEVFRAEVRLAYHPIDEARAYAVTLARDARTIEDQVAASPRPRPD